MRKRPTEVASVYEDTSYRRTVPKSVGGNGGGSYYGHEGASHHGAPITGDGTVATTSQTSAVVTNIKTLVVIIFITRRGRGRRVKKAGFTGTLLSVTAIGASEDN